MYGSQSCAKVLLLSELEHNKPIYKPNNLEPDLPSFKSPKPMAPRDCLATRFRLRCADSGSGPFSAAVGSGAPFSHLAALLDGIGAKWIVCGAYLNTSQLQMVQRCSECYHVQ